MDNKGTAADIPEIKIAKVGDKRERKKGGAAAWFEGSGKGAFSGATGGAGAGAAGSVGNAGFDVLSFLESVLGRQLAMMLPKILVALMIAGLGVGAICIGRAVRGLGDRKDVAAKPKPFEAKEAQDDSNSVKDVRPKDSVGMVAGSLDGKTQAERAADAAAAAAAAKAAADAQAAKDKSATDAAAAAGSAGPAGMDPAAMAAAAAGAAGGAGKADPTKKASFGAFGSSLGGSSGSSGSLAPVGLAHGINGGAKLGGGLTSMRRPGASTFSNSALSRNTGFKSNRGLGFNSLVAASKLSQAGAHSGVNETAATNANNAFNGNPAGSDSVVSGSGDGSSPNSSSGGTGNAGAGGGSSGGGGAGDSGPTLGGSGGPAVGDNCGVLFPSGGYISSAGGGCTCPAGEDASSASSGCAPSTGHTNATPYQNMDNIGNTLLEVATVLLLLAVVFALCKNIPYIGAAMYAIAEYLAIAAAICAGIVTLMGIAMLAMGGSAKGDGLTFTLVGGLLTIVSAVVAETCSAGSATSPTSTIQAAQPSPDLMAGGPEDVPPSAPGIDAPAPTANA
jgi:hypothetical protein